MSNALPSACPPAAPTSPGDLRSGGVLWGGVLLVLMGLGLFAVSLKLEYCAGDSFIGHADQAAYAGMARGLTQGRGLQVNYVSFFFLQYPGGIVHREDHWPPLLSIMIWPFFEGLGISAQTARIAPILIGSLLLPLSAAWLAWAFCRRAAVGLAAALFILGSPVLFRDSSAVLSDELVAFLVTAFLAAVVESRRRPWLMAMAGALAGAAFYAKGSEITLVGLLPVAALAVIGWRILRCPWLWVGMALWLLAVSPWLVSNYRAYGHILHSTQQYVSGYIGLDDWESRTYDVYWDRTPPRLSDRWTTYQPRFWGVWRQNARDCVRTGLFGPDAPGSSWLPSWNGLRTTSWWGRLRIAVGFAAVTWFGFAIFWTAGRRLMASPTRALQPFSLYADGQGATAAILVVLLAHAALLISCWSPYPRLCFLFVPATTVIGCTCLLGLFEAAIPRSHRRRAEFVLVLIATAGLAAWLGVARGAAAYEAGLLPARHVSQGKECMAAAAWIEQHLPGAVVMASNPWELQFHAGGHLRCVSLPAAPPTAILRVARYYGVTHILDDSLGVRKRIMESWRDGGTELRPIDGCPVPLYEIAWGRVALTDAAPLGGAEAAE